jgi:hypothetical protein
MRKYREPKCMRELRAIRDQIYKEAKAVGFDRYYEELNKKAGWLLGKSKRTPCAAAVRERPARYKAR